MASRQEDPEEYKEESLAERIGEGIGYGISIILIPLFLLCIIMLFHARIEYLF
jgi:hypothetical protein